MPWTPSDSSKHTHKADTPKKQAQWSAIADSVLSKTGDEASAIRQANGVIAKYRHKDRKGD
jgi:hypothetical protein